MSPRPRERDRLEELGMPSKKKTSYGRRKSSFLGGEGVRKKGQISLVKEQKEEGIDIRGGGRVMTRFLFSFSNKSMPRKNYKNHIVHQIASKGIP